ncbi:hypothetical protein AMC96_09935 [Klebsiella pneumoniae]|nr:hypothetical protein AMC96_09935 [Klebsiella pneumoniae]
MQVRNTSFLPFSKPVKANHTSTTKANNESLTQFFPIVRRWRAIADSQRERNSSAIKIGNVNGTKEFSVIARSSLRPALNLSTLSAGMIIFHRRNPSRQTVMI